MMLKEKDMELSYVIKINRYPGLKELCQKKNTNFVVEKFKQYYSGKFD